jgi:hypothetical protein
LEVLRDERYWETSWEGGAAGLTGIAWRGKGAEMVPGLNPDGMLAAKLETFRGFFGGIEGSQIERVWGVKRSAGDEKSSQKGGEESGFGAENNRGGGRGTSS